MNKDKVYFENLDGLRFLAFLSVFFFHSFYTPFNTIKNNEIYSFAYQITRYGWLGVNFFFVLSGFLITYLILLEEKNYGKVSIKHFYIRRILRIWPLYYLIVMFCFFVYPTISEYFAMTPDGDLPSIHLFIFHLSNYSYIYTPSEIPTLNILWSISIEEQFYLVWPILLFFVKGKFRYILLLLLIMISFIFMWENQDNFHYYHHHILSCMGDLSIGGLSAILILNNKSFFQFFESLTRKSIYIGYCLMGIYFAGMTFNFINNNSLITAICFSFIILEQNYSLRSPFKISKFRLFTYLGRYTYGLYCYHYLALLLAIKISMVTGLNETVFGVVIFENMLGLIISIVVAIASYHIYELPFLRLKNKFAFYTKSN